MISVNTSGIDKILEKLQSQSIDDKLREVARRLCVEVGEPIIKATHEGHGANKVWSEPTENGYQIIADGDKVYFVEFGTGDATGQERDKYINVPDIVRPGSYSEAHQGEYWRTGGYKKGVWHFGGREYHETAPNPAFYEAYAAMRQALPRIAKEVFSS